MIKYQHATVDGHKIFYREAGSKTAPAILLLHGFPTSSHMFRNLIPELADRYHVVAPDLPGFGFSDAPDRKQFRYTFENLARAIDNFTQTIGLERFAIYVSAIRPCQLYNSGPPPSAEAPPRHGLSPYLWQCSVDPATAEPCRAAKCCRRNNQLH